MLSDPSLPEMDGYDRKLKTLVVQLGIYRTNHLFRLKSFVDANKEKVDKLSEYLRNNFVNFYNWPR